MFAALAWSNRCTNRTAPTQCNQHSVSNNVFLYSCFYI